jgi:GxxExxY protein
MKKGLEVRKEVSIPVVFEKVRMDCGYRADLIIGKKVIVEVKSIEAIADVHIAQLVAYLKFCNCKLGLLINFNVPQLKKGIRRVVNKLLLLCGLC